MKTIEVPIEPSQEFYFYGDRAVFKNKKLSQEIVLEYWYEPPHGDKLYDLKIDGLLAGNEKEFKVWGRSIFLSEDMRFFVACRGLNDLKLFCIDLTNDKYCDLDSYSLIDNLEGYFLSVRTYRKKGPGPSILVPQVIDLSNASDWKKLNKF